MFLRLKQLFSTPARQLVSGSLLVIFLLPMGVHAGGFFETGRVTIPDSIDAVGGGWETVTLTQSYVNPVVIAGALTHNNSHTLFTRVRMVNSTTFEIGMQSPCENLGTYAGPNGSDPSPEQDVCPPAAGWQAETAYYWVMEEGVWEFPTGEEVEAFTTSVNAIRSGAGGTTPLLQQELMHTFASSDVVVFHTINSDNDPDFVVSTATSDTSVGVRPGPTAADNDFGLALELMETQNAHGAEDIGWIAMLEGNGTNAGADWSAGITPGDDVDRHQDGCFTVGAYAVGNNPDLITTQNTMNGGNGGAPRLCGTEVGNANFQVHVDEDQVNDTERSGIPEVVNWFAFTAGEHGALDFLVGQKTASESGNDGEVETGDSITYTISITNVLDDFDQPDNASGPELIDPLPGNVSFVSVDNPGGGSLIYNAALNRMEWNGAVAAGATVTIEYTVEVDTDACPGTEVRNQATILMDVNGDGVNAITELTDDPAADIEGDIDNDNETDDDDPTVLDLLCPVLTLEKIVMNNNSGTATTSSFVLSATGPVNLSGVSGTSTVTNVIVAPGTYNLSETVISGYTASAWSCDDGSLTGSSLTLESTDDATCTITNTDIVVVDLQLDKSVSNDEPVVGSTVTFTIEVENLGPDTATAVQIVDVVPAGFTYVAGTIAGGDSRNDSSPAGTGLTWTINSLASTASSTLTFDATVNPP